ATAYSAAKAAIANFTRTIAVQLAPHNIRVNAIVPNKIGSPVGRDEFDPTRPVQNMLKRAGRPEEAAKAILFLASDDSSFVIGENLFVDGGTMAMDQNGSCRLGGGNGSERRTEALHRRQRASRRWAGDRRVLHRARIKMCRVRGRALEGRLPPDGKRAASLPRLRRPRPSRLPVERRYGADPASQEILHARRGCGPVQPDARTLRTAGCAGRGSGSGAG